MGVARECGEVVLKGWEGWRKEGVENMALGRKGRGMRREMDFEVIVGDEGSSSVHGRSSTAWRVEEPLRQQRISASDVS